MLNLELDHASERRLAEEARKIGLTTERYAALLLQEAMTSQSDPSGPSVLPRVGTSVEAWERELERLIEDQDDSIPPISDEALRRESLHEGRS